jgi:hypothetical protein
MKTRPLRSLLKGVLASAALLAVTLPSAWAVPSFARQTGMACSTCHTVFPELTPFGREFKLNGYVLDNMKQIKGITVQRTETMSLNQIPPLSLMAQISYNHTSQAVPDTGNPAVHAQAGEANFPQQVSFFYAGKIADGLGSFVQLTYNGVADHFALDNTDIRYVQHLSLDPASERELIAGVTLNNNPTVQDPWNSTAAWGYPFAGSFVAPTPHASTRIDTAGIGQTAAGLGGYLWYEHSIYAEVSLYTGQKVGGTHPLDSSQTPLIHGVAPYWRLAYERRWDQNSWSIGTYGIRASVSPVGTVAGSVTTANPSGTPLSLNGPYDKYTDYAFDTQYQYITDDHQVSVLGTYIHEKQSLDASFPNGLSANSSDNLNTAKLAANYYYRRKIGGSFGFFNTTGSTDTGLYAPASVSGSANGSPSSRGYVFEVNYLPFLNVKLQLQYTAYSKFNGGSGNYDGSGRSASDNNTLYVLGWFNF